MNRLAIALHREEAGGSAVSFVMVLPILITLVCAIVDLGRLAFIEAELDNATQTACKWASSQVSLANKSDLGSQEVLQAVKEASPSLASPGLRCSAKLQRSEASSVAYLRHSFNAETDSFEDQVDSIASSKVSVFATVEGTYLTPLGSLLSQGNDGSFSLSAQAVRTVHVAEADDGKE